MHAGVHTVVRKPCISTHVSANWNTGAKHQQQLRDFISTTTSQKNLGGKAVLAAGAEVALAPGRAHGCGCWGAVAGGQERDAEQLQQRMRWALGASTPAGRR